MDENNIIDAEFEEVPDEAGAGQTDPPIVEPELEEPNFEPAIEQPPQEETPSALDKAADFIGVWAAAIMLTFIASIGLAFFFTFIPVINFSFPLVLKCWAGIWSILMARGVSQNKTF